MSAVLTYWTQEGTRKFSADFFGVSLVIWETEGGGWAAKMTSSNGQVIAEDADLPSADVAATATAGDLVAWVLRRATTADILAMVEEYILPGDIVQTEIAQLLGVSHPVVHYWQSGDRQMSRVVRQHVLTMGGVRRSEDRHWLIGPKIYLPAGGE